MAMEYSTLSAADKLSIARDALRGRESDHFRLSLMDTVSGSSPERLKEIESEIESMQKETASLEKEFEAADKKSGRKAALADGK